MYLGFTPVAEASVMTLMKSINRVIINPIIFFLFALALVYFLYGVAQYLLNPDSEDIRKSSKSHMLYGVIGLFIMVAVFGIMNLILKTTGADKKIKIQETGNYEIVDNSNGSDFYNYEGDNPTPIDIGYSSINPFTEVDLGITSSASNIATSQNLTYGESPFTNAYLSDAYFNRVKGIGFNPLLKIARDLALRAALNALGIDVEINDLTIVYPMYRILEEKYMLRPDGNYEYWIAVESSKTTPSSDVVYNSTKASPFVTLYDSSIYFTKV